MSTIARPAAHVRPVSAGALQRHYGPRWSIWFDLMRMVWFAERRQGTALRVLAAHQPYEMAIKIEAAEREDGAARWVSASSGPDWRDDAGDTP